MSKIYKPVCRMCLEKGELKMIDGSDTKEYLKTFHETTAWAEKQEVYLVTKGWYEELLMYRRMTLAA